MKDILFIGIAVYMGYQWGKADAIKAASQSTDCHCRHKNLDFDFSKLNCQNIMN